MNETPRKTPNMAQVLLTADEVLLIRAYRSCTLENRAHVRYFAAAAASERDECTATVLPLVAKSLT